MPTITFTVEGPGDGTGTLRFRARENYTNSDGEIVTTRDSLRIVAYTTNVQTSVVLPTGPWEVSGLATKVPVPFDVGSSNANLKDLIVFPIPANAPATTLSQAVAAWMDSNVNTEVTEPLVEGILANPESGARAVLDETYGRVWKASTAYAAGDLVLLPAPVNGPATRNTSGTSRGSFDATEQGLWTATGGGVSSWNDLDDKPAVIAAGADAPTARAAIGAVGSAEVSTEVAEQIAADGTVVAAAADAVEADIAGRDLVQRTDPGAPKVEQFVPDDTLVGIADASGRMTFLAANDSDGGPTAAAGKLITRHLNPDEMPDDVSTEVARKAGIEQSTQPGILAAIAAQDGTRTWLEATDTDGGPTPHALELLDAAGVGNTAAPREKTMPARRYLDYALADQRTRKLKAVVIGASSAEGSNAAATYSMASQLEKMLQNSYNPPGIPGGYVTKARDGGFWAPSGTTTSDDLDLGLKNRGLAPGASVSHTTVQMCTGVEVWYMQGDTYAGGFTVTIDGGTPTTITPAGGADAPTGVWTSPVLARGIHTVVITALGQSSIGQCTIFDGDRDRGWVLYQGAHAGYATADFLTPAAEQHWTRLAAINPDLVFVMLGSNDKGNSVPYSTYQTRLTEIVSRINTAGDRTPWIVLIAQHNRDATGPAWAGYQEAMQAVADATDNATYVSYREFFPTSVTDPDELIDTDDTHMTSRGHVYAAQLIAAMLDLPSRQTFPAIPPSS